MGCCLSTAASVALDLIPGVPSIVKKDWMSDMFDEQEEDNRRVTMTMTNGKLDYSDRKCLNIPCCIALMVFALLFIAFIIVSFVAGNLSFSDFILPEKQSDNSYNFENNDLQQINMNSHLTLKSEQNLTTAYLLKTIEEDANNSGITNTSKQKNFFSIDVDNSYNISCHQNHNFEIIDKNQRMQVASKRKDDKKDILTEDIDLVSKVWVVLVGYSIVTVVSLLWILCMCRCASSCLRASVWVSVIVDLLSGIGFIVIAAFQSKKSHNDTFSNYDDAVMYVSGAISAVFFIFLLVMLIINNENVSIVSEMFKEAAKAIKDRAGLLLVVIILAIISIVVGWLSSYVSIVYYQCMFRIYFNIGFNALTIINFILLIFANIFAVWFESFIEHLNKAIIAATTVEWYYSEGDPNKRKWPILHAIKYTLSKSIGAVAFGSFLDYLNEALEDIAKSIGTFAFAFSLVGNFFNYCSKPNKKQNNVEEEEEDSGFVASCCMCLFRFAMKFYAVFFYAVALALFLVAMIVKLIGSKPSDFVEAECERIYAMSCIEGKPFIESSKDTMCLIVRNIDSVITFDIIASSLKKSIKWSITLVANIVCLLIWRPDFFGLSDPVDYPVWSILFGESLIFNYLNESIIIDTFMTAVNSILICRLTKKEYDDHKDQGFVEINRDLTDPFAFMNNEIEESVNKCMEKIENRGKNIHQSSVLYLERQANRFQPERPEAATEPMVRLPTENTSQSSNQSSEREMTIQEENNGNSSDESAKV